MRKRRVYHGQPLAEGECIIDIGLGEIHILGRNSYERIIDAVYDEVCDPRLGHLRGTEFQIAAAGDIRHHYLEAGGDDPEILAQADPVWWVCHGHPARRALTGKTHRRIVRFSQIWDAAAFAVRDSAPILDSRGNISPRSFGRGRAKLVAMINETGLVPGGRPAVPCTRPRKTIAEAESVPIEIGRSDLASLRREALAAYNAGPAPAPADDPGFLDRVTVNFIRRHHSPYVALLHAFAESRAQQTIHYRVLDAIGEAYPELADECQNQRYGIM